MGKFTSRAKSPLFEGESTGGGTLKYKQGTDLIDLRRLLEGLIFGMDPFGGLGGCFGLQTASEVRSDLRFEISDLDYLHIHVHIAYMFWAHFEALMVAAEATTATERPQISNFTSDLEFVAQIAYATMFVWAI